MPSKGKVAKPKAQEAKTQPTKASSAAPPPSSSSPATTAAPATVYDRSLQRFAEANPLETAREKAGLNGLSPADRAAWTNGCVARSPYLRNRLSTKAQRELWKNVNEASLPLRVLEKPAPNQWGRDRNGQDIGAYTAEQLEERTTKQLALTVQQSQSQRFRAARSRAQRGARHSKTGDPVVVTGTEIDAERTRRREIAALRNELYGDAMPGRYALDPVWDDVVPVPAEEPEAALAAITYRADYAEAISYLRAVMLKKEYSRRCLALTEDIIMMNPGHYTVWLYRASIIFALQMPILEEMAWLNQVSLEYLKNYQIWHHRHLLVDNYYPQIAGKPDEVAAFARSERAFVTQMFDEDTKNYHVWSYRSFLVGLLGMWDADELASVDRMIADDVRNNSAWSHRFYVVFSDPAHSTPGCAATERDPKIPDDLVDREVRYAQDKTYLAPQNQSPWNYLKGVLVKGGRKLATVEPFVLEFVRDIGEDAEDVKSTHALDLLAEIYAEKGDKEKADLCLRRLGEKWDRIRVGYWEWRRKCV